MKIKKDHKFLCFALAVLCLCFFTVGCDREEKQELLPPAETETGEQEEMNDEDIALQINDEEAKAFFNNITGSVYYHLLEMPVNDLSDGISPYYWIWIASPEHEGILEELTEPYITQEEKSAYSGENYQLYYAAYAKSDLQKGLDRIWGEATITWDEVIGQQQPPTVIETENYLLAAQGFGGPYDEQFFQIKEISCSDATAIVRVYALEHQTDDTIVDLSDRTTDSTREQNGVRTTIYHYGALGTLPYQEGATVESILNNLDVSFDSLGTVDFHLEKDENGNIYLTEIQCSH